MKKFLPILATLFSLSAIGQTLPNAVDLSKDGTANCYIVAPGSTGSFNATFKGNSTTEKVGDISGVKLVWQTKKSLINQLEFDVATNTIYAKTSATPGNALVAAVDQNGEILWSWHLWVTEYDPANDYTSPANANGTTWTFMDRNLGATTTERGSFDNFGMLYQWGRKDPFPGAATQTVMNPDYTYEKDGEPELYDINNNVLPKISSKKAYHGTIELSIKNPDSFFAMTYKKTGQFDENGVEIVENDYISGDWVDVSDDDYWGGVSMKKSIYDPSPVGYMVPVCDENGSTPYEWLKYTSMTWDATNKGASQNGQWFPATGTRAYASGTLDFPEGSNPYSGLWIGTKGTSSSADRYGQYMFIINGKRTFKVSKDKRSQGLSVRCVREKVNPTAVDDLHIDNTNAPAPIFNLQGTIVVKQADPSQLNSLAPGIYIYKSKKIIVR